MTYGDLTNALAAYLVESLTETNFAVALPRIIEQAELRCYRECDFIATRQYSTTAITAGTAVLGGPPTWLIGRAVATISGLGARANLDRRDETFLQEYWPVRSAYAVGFPPKYWAEMGIGTLLIAPAADQAYTLEMVFTGRPAPLTAANPTTWLATNCPDLLFYAAMVAASGYQKNFGAASENPQMALAWEGQYQTAKGSAMVEEGRRKGEATFDVVSPPPATVATHGA